MPKSASIFSRTGLAVLIWGTLCAALAAFVLFHKQSLVAPDIDVNGFGLLSRNLALGDGFSLGYGDTIRRAPLYPMLGALLLKIFGNYAPGTPDAITYQPIIVAQCLLFGLTCLVTWATARRLFGARVALVAALACPLVPQALRYIGQTEVETLMGLFIALLAYTGLRLYERPSITTGVIFGLTAAAATLTKPVTQFYPVFFLALAWLLWSWQRRSTTGLLRTWLRPSIAVLAVFAVPILPWVARDWVVTGGQFVGISSNAPGETLRGFVAVQPKYFLLQQNFADWDPEANTYEEDILRAHGMPFYRWNSPSAGSMTVVPPLPAGVASASLDAQKDQIESVVLKDRIFSQPIDFVRKFVTQVPTFWYLVVDRRQSFIVGVIALGVLALSALGARRAMRQHAIVWPILAIVVYLNVIYASTLAMARYSMPLYPTLMVVAAAGLLALLGALVPSTWQWPRRAVNARATSTG